MFNIDFKLIIILILGICLAKLFDYDVRVNRSNRILYFLLPVALIVLLFYNNYHEAFLSPSVKRIITLLGLFVFIFSFYIYFHTQKQAYPHNVYNTSVYIIWAITIIFCLIYLYDDEVLVKASLLKLILFIGLLISLVGLK